MMQLTKLLFGMFLLCLCGVSVAQSPEDCFNNLRGGGYSDNECFSQKSNNLKKINKSISLDIQKKLKAISRRDFYIFKKFLRSHEARLEYCSLLRNAEGPEKNDSSHIRYYDVIYAECIFKEVELQNSILKKIAMAWSVEPRVER